MNAYQKFQLLSEQVTGEVISQLEQGKVLWHKPWGSYGLPKNYFSGRHYEGFNAFFLNYITEKHGFSAPYFLTFRQVRELGGLVRKGQKGTSILYWKVYDSKEAEKSGGLTSKDEDRQGKRFVPFLWTVFNIDQVEGIDFQLPPIQEQSGQQVIASCQRVVDNFPQPCPKILHGGFQAYYAPVQDTVQMPELRHFVSSEAYHATLFHELIHATGHVSRLNRFAEEGQADRFGDEHYSKEELIAEMGASFLCAYTGIKEAVFQNSVAYLQGWVSRLQQDKTMIIYAATKAFKAASYIVDLKAESCKEALPKAKAAA
ncbi:ArdC family protein [Pontibacter sp. MBLB2868]|uniref:ArdC family protein n=1 Tax=Pontibacter sp. MBLB2868 TaxID=3451555 RepID=UPI003F74CD2B